MVLCWPLYGRPLKEDEGGDNLRAVDFPTSVFIHAVYAQNNSTVTVNIYLLYTKAL